MDPSASTNSNEEMDLKESYHLENQGDASDFISGEDEAEAIGDALAEMDMV